MDPSAELATLRAEIAVACRVLAARGLADGFLGHISLRVSDSAMLVRCRGRDERGLAWTSADDIRLVTFDGAAAAPGELDGWQVPNELPLHAAVLRSRPLACAVVHAHPPAVVAADLAGLRIRPIVGAFDIPGAHLASGGIPVYSRGVLIRTPELASEMVAAMGERPVVVLRGHGTTASGASVPEAVLRTVSVDTIARMSLAVASAGGTLVDLPDADLAELPDLGPDFTRGTAWRHELARLEVAR